MPVLSLARARIFAPMLCRKKPHLHAKSGSPARSAQGQPTQLCEPLCMKSALPFSSPTPANLLSPVLAGRIRVSRPSSELLADSASSTTFSNLPPSALPRPSLLSHVRHRQCPPSSARTQTNRKHRKVRNRAPQQQTTVRRHRAPAGRPKAISSASETRAILLCTAVRRKRISDLASPGARDRADTHDGRRRIHIRSIFRRRRSKG